MNPISILPLRKSYCAFQAVADILLGCIECLLEVAIQELQLYPNSRWVHNPSWEIVCVFVFRSINFFLSLDLACINKTFCFHLQKKNLLFVFESIYFKPTNLRKKPIQNEWGRNENKANSLRQSVSFFIVNPSPTHCSKITS